MQPEKCILIAEDSEADVLTLRRAFKHSGFTGPVRVVENGADAVAYLNGEGEFANRVHYPFPDLLILDLKMPGTNGFEVLQWLRGQEEPICALRTVVLTTSGDILDVNRAYELGANSFLAKPLEDAEFKNCIEAVMRFWLSLSRAPEIKENVRKVGQLRLLSANDFRTAR